MRMILRKTPLKVYSNLKVAQYSFLGVRGIGTNGVSARVLYFITNFYFDDVLTRNKLGVFQTANFFGNWHWDRLFLSLTVRKKSSNFTHTLMQYMSQTKIANSSKIYRYVQIFL